MQLALVTAILLKSSTNNKEPSSAVYVGGLNERINLSISTASLHWT